MHVRTAVAAVAIAGLCTVPFAMSADASPARHGHDAAAASSKAAPSPIVKGVVADQFGAYVDDVKVQATDKKGKPVASALTYASKWDSGPQHGFFFLEVGAKGSYTLTLSKSGYQTRTLDVEVTKRRVPLGELTIKKNLAVSHTSAALEDKSITTKQSGEITVTVTSSATKRPTGDIEILEGRHVVATGELKPGSKGEATIDLGKLGKGEHDLVASYLGSSTLKASKSGTVTLVVKKARR